MSSMREIKFRGKRDDNGEWVYGDLINKHHNIIIGCSIETEYTASDNEPSVMFKYEMHSVIPETIGQFTGEKDSKGVDIYEGDLAKDDDNLYASIDWNQLTFTYDGEWLNDFNGAIEVIGNIHDNPELLETWKIRTIKKWNKST